MTTREALRRPAFPFLLAVMTAVGVSIAAYAGMVPGFVAAHGIDKVLHAATGATLTWLLTRALHGRVRLAATLVLAALATDEYFQRYSGVRSSDWADLAADVAGAGAVVLVYGCRGRRARHASARSTYDVPSGPTTGGG